MAQTTEEKLAKIHAEAISEFDAIQEALREERLQCLQDRRFYSIAGAQWEGKLRDQFANKPQFEFNKIHLSVIRIFNEYLNNRITVDFVSKDGSENDKLADVCDGLYRADEQDSFAREAYDNAFEEAVGGGIGAWRLHASYEDEYDEDNDYQRIKIAPIFDADSSVFYDLNAKRQDKSDAKKCWVITSIARKDYIDEHDDDPSSWPKEITQTYFDWYTPDVVYIAEYYKVEEVKETIRIFQTLTGTEERYSKKEFEDDPELEGILSAVGTKEIGTKKVKRRRIHKYIMSGSKVIEDCGYIPGKCIPIVPVYGKRWFVDNIERCMGHVRISKDAQRLKNMQLSKLAEISALSSIEKAIMFPEQIAGHQVMWAEDNIEDFPYLLINQLTDASGQPVPAPPVAYTRVPNIPPAMAALLQLTEQDMKEMLGNQQEGDKMVSNVSGKAVEMIQTRIDMQAFIYMNGLAVAMRRSGDIWLSMAKELYIDPGRKMKVINKQNKIQQIELIKPSVGKDGESEPENDLTRANFDVTSDVGVSSSSKRAATVRALTGMMTITTDQETLSVLSSMAMMNMEGEGLDDVQEYFRRKLIKMGAIKPTEEEAQELAKQMAQAKPDANTLYLNAAAEKAQADATKSRADTVYTIARTEGEKADTIKTLSEVDATHQQQALEVMDRFLPQQPQLV